MGAAPATVPAGSLGACPRLGRAVPVVSRLGAVSSQRPAPRSPTVKSAHEAWRAGERLPCDRSSRRGEEGAAGRPAAGPGSRREVPGTAPHAGGEQRPRAGGGGSKGRRGSTLWCALPAAVARPRGLSAAPPPRRLYRPRFRPRYFRPAARWGEVLPPALPRRPRWAAPAAARPGPPRPAPAASAPLAAAPPRSAAAPGAGSAGGGRRGAMGAYLSQPNTVKSSGDGAGLGPRPLHFGFSAMQGWRVSMEDAHNCIPELDSETAMFSVYDGHGGEEVALYCAKYLPEIIKDQKAYKEGKLQKALEDAFLAIDAKLTTEEVIKELSQMAGRPQDDEDEKQKVADEDDVDNEEAALLHEEATMTIEELLTRYGQNCTKNLKQKSLAPAGENATEGTGKQHDGESNMNGEADPGELIDHKERKNGKPDEEITGISSTSDKANTGGNSPALQKPEVGKGDEAVTSSTGEAGPSCSSTGKPQRTTKSKFFEDSEDESDEVEEEEEDSEECSEDEDGYSSEEAENEDDEDDTEEAEEDEDEEEEMLLPGMEGKEEPGSDSGTTAVVALIRGKQLIVANAGDSRCVVSEGGKAVDMSYDHKPEDEIELARIKNAGGKVTMDGRVNGGLNLSRAIGDHFYKRNRNLPPEEQMISALPDIKVLTINDDHDFMVIACDGIWNVMSSQEVVDFIQSKITQKDENGVLRPLSSIVEELLDQCLAPDTSGDGTGCDNMTCIIISFKPRNTHPPAESGKRKLEDMAAPATPAEENGSDNKKKAKLE